ncbi:DUF3006 family protein [Virgibacillus sp. C22-A2]|uniref:DUF3006 family protein n=1 Tax=Virgibacillus tibetensis TaxID=3042313 RepID=A0ABU6KDA2_9BACI|nr:DUF3006 family protein [Virgibacillus sp. C22-A2]
MGINSAMYLQFIILSIGFYQQPEWETKAVLDRLENNDQAVILIEEWKEEVIVPISNLPAGSAVNIWFHVEKQDGEIAIVSIDYKTSALEALKVRRLMDKLKLE